LKKAKVKLKAFMESKEQLHDRLLLKINYDNRNREATKYISQQRKSLVSMFASPLLDRKILDPSHLSPELLNSERSKS
jgi:hypothetical protein